MPVINDGRELCTELRGDFSLKIKNAIISVHDKQGLKEFSALLNKFGARLFATDGTADFLEKAGITVKRVSSITGFTSLLEGRVKTLHPAIFAAILSRPERREDEEQLDSLGVPHFDMVVSNLYPFEDLIASGEKDLDKLLENIDIGGISLTRAAAKNYSHVAVVSDIKQYKAVAEEMEKFGGAVSEAMLEKLCVEAFQGVSFYDGLISTVLGDRFKSSPFPDRLVMIGRKKSDLKYGENPYQRAASYFVPFIGSSVLNAAIDSGKSLSYNNLLDISNAVDVLRDFTEPSCVVVKHANPCGVATAGSAEHALRAAYDADSLSAYGSVIGLNKPIGRESAEYLSNKFVEVILAPDYDEDALAVLRRKKRLRILTFPGIGGYTDKPEKDVRRISGGFLVQEVAAPDIRLENLKVVTETKPTPQDIDSMIFANRVVRHLWSNAIVLADGTVTVGMGTGQSSRVDAVKLAIMKSRGKARGSVLASDAFFPFRDGIDEAANGGIRAIIQPGGSIRDDEVISAADEHHIAMVFTGIRLFRH